VTGGAMAESIVGSLGGDTIDGGTGTDSLDLQAIDGGAITGSDAVDGVVVNLGTATIDNASVVGAISTYTGNNLDVTGGKIAYTYVANKTTNSTEQMSIQNVENIVGSDEEDYIVGSNANNDLMGDAKYDFIDCGAGNDTITGGAGDDTTNGGDGDDTFKVTTGTEADDDIIDGGGDSDTVTVADGLTLTVSGDTDLTNVEKLNFEAAGVIKITTQTEGFIVSDGSTADKDAVLHGGQGDDTFTSSNALDTDQIIMLAAATNGNDTYTGFTVGSGLDKIDFTAAKSTGYQEYTSAANTIDTGIQGMIVLDYSVAGVSGTMSAAALYAATSASGNTAGNGGESVYVATTTDATNAADVFFFFATMNVGSSSFATADLLLTMTGITDTTAFHTSNFDVA
jgi:Ca2+-binding RTX toxin-like protein